MNTVEPLDLTNTDGLAVMMSAARKVALRYPLDTTEEGLYQAAWEWMLRHPNTTQEAIDACGEGRRALERTVVAYLTLKAREVRARRLGYLLEDEAFYSQGLISTLLPLALDPDGLINPPTEREGRPQKGDPASGGSLAAMVMDVRRAYARLNGWHATFVYARFGENMTPENISASYEVPVDEVNAHIARALRHMSEFLGGSPGRGCPSGCECEA